MHTAPASTVPTAAEARAVSPQLDKTGDRDACTGYNRVSSCIPPQHPTRIPSRSLHYWSCHVIHNEPNPELRPWELQCCDACVWPLAPGLVRNAGYYRLQHGRWLAGRCAGDRVCPPHEAMEDQLQGTATVGIAIHRVQTYDLIFGVNCPVKKSWKLLCI